MNLSKRLFIKRILAVYAATNQYYALYYTVDKSVSLIKG